jgi:hypothetical protein
MHLSFSPVRMDAELTLHRDGETLTVNGRRLELSDLPEGGRLAPACDWLASDITREGGALRLTLILPHGPWAPEATRFPAPVIDPPDGPVALPPWGAPPPPEPGTAGP